MAVIEGGVSAALVEVDTTHKAARVTVRPTEALGWLSIAAKSGALTGVAANGPVFSFRNLSANPVMLRSLGVGFVCTTAFTAAQVVDYSLIVARSFSVSDSVGTAIALTGSTNKHRTSLATLTSVDCRISAAVALTAGTRTLDTNIMSANGAWIGAVGAALAPSRNNLFQHDPEDYPLVLAQNEGFIIQNLTAMGAAGVGTLYVNCELVEVTSY